MSTLAGALKAEISRLARKEVRAEVQHLAKQASKHRTQIAALNRRIHDLERQLAAVRKAAGRASSPPANDLTPDGKFRYSARSVAAQRKRLGLSAEMFGKLIGVSGQSIYKWEAGAARPRASQMPAIAAVRGLSKVDAASLLPAMD